MPKYRVTSHNDAGKSASTIVQANTVSHAYNSSISAVMAWPGWRVTSVIEVEEPEPPKQVEEPEPPKQVVISRWSIGGMAFRITSDGKKFHLYDTTMLPAGAAVNEATCLWSSRSSDELLLLAARMANGEQ